MRGSFLGRTSSAPGPPPQPVRHRNANPSEGGQEQASVSKLPPHPPMHRSGSELFKAVSACPVIEEGPPTDLKDLHVVTWNIAAPNSNPFEYWATHESDEYVALMTAVQRCLDSPGDADVLVGEIFTDAMYQELRHELFLQDLTNLDELDELWTGDLSKRESITRFLKEPSFGDKRLISMPDRITSSLKNESGRVIFRPSPISGCNDDISDLPTWWKLWVKFMFKTSVLVRGEVAANVFSILELIPRSKYPALSEAEEALSLPLQTLCLAIFDAVLIFLLSSVSAQPWQPLKWSLHKSLYEDKAASCVSILQCSYKSADVMFIQEASEAFASKAWSFLDFFVMRPNRVDGKRSQMSVILLRRTRFVEATATDITDEVLQRLKCVERGDLCVGLATACDGQAYLLACFHGDSSGRATCPVLSEVHELARVKYSSHVLIFGLDANTAAGRAESGSSLDVARFCAHVDSIGLSSCWKGHEVASLWTTFSARTFLQPQLQKAVGFTDVMDACNMHLKDWILFYDVQLAAADVERDNTGRRTFQRTVIPSQEFPSDHAIVSATLRHCL